MRDCDVHKFIGKRVITAGILAYTKEEARSFFVHPKHIDARVVSKPGTLGHHVPGCGGDVWWVKHDDDTIGAYLFTEFDPLVEEEKS